MSGQYPSEAYELLDQRDEEQILAEIKGAIIDQMFYSFKVDGKTVTGISWVGTKEIARRYGGISMDFVKMEETDTSYIAIVKATDTRQGTSLLGTAMQTKLMKVRGVEKPDRFAYTKAVSKAQRNAIRAIIPERFLIEMYEFFKKGIKPKREPRLKKPRKQVEAQATVRTLDDEPRGSAEEDPDVETVVNLLEERGLRTTNLIIVKKDGKIWIQHSSGLTQDKFNDYNDVLQGEFGGSYHRALSTWSVEPKQGMNENGFEAAS